MSETGGAGRERTSLSLSLSLHLSLLCRARSLGGKKRKKSDAVGPVSRPLPGRNLYLRHRDHAELKGALRLQKKGRGREGARGACRPSEIDKCLVAAAAAREAMGFSQSKSPKRLSFLLRPRLLFAHRRAPRAVANVERPPWRVVEERSIPSRSAAWRPQDEKRAEAMAAAIAFFLERTLFRSSSSLTPQSLSLSPSLSFFTGHDSRPARARQGHGFYGARRRRQRQRRRLAAAAPAGR